MFCSRRHDRPAISRYRRDRLLDKAETLRVDRPADGTEVRLCVAVDADTLHELEERAAAAGTDLSAAAADALRAGAHAA